MLILTRRIQESITIGDNVTITVLSVKGNQIRLGIDAPRDVEVHREEIYHKVKSGSMDTPMQRKNKLSLNKDDAEIDDENIGNR